MKSKLKKLLFPTEQQKIMSKWRSDKGDKRLRLDYELDERSVVLDLGGYEGEWAQQMFDRYGCHIMIFEPVEQFASKIKQRFANNDNVTAFHFGLGGSTRSETISTCGDGSSIFTGEGPSEQIELVDIVSFMDQHDVSSVSLMKINVEGGEYEILNRLADHGYSDRIENIQVQFHDFVENAEPRMIEVQEKLAQTHALTYQYKFIWENWKKKQ